MADTTTARTGARTETAVTDTGAAAAAEPATATIATAPAAAARADTTPSASAQAPEVRQAAPADWAPDWREKLSGGDKKELERLARLASPVELYKSYRALEQRVSSGDVKKPLPENPTPEQIAEYRKERGIPETPEAYKIELPHGIVPGEADKPLLEAFTKAVHEKNWDNDKVNEALSWYFSEQDRQKALRGRS
jgi:hypothetical protein